MFKSRFFLIGLLLTIFLIWSLLEVPLFTKQYATQLDRLYGMNWCFQDGQIPCRWVPGLDNFYGFPIFNYSPPLPYYFGEFIFFITKNLAMSAKVILLVALIGSYILMYFYLSRFLDSIKAVVFSFLYSVLVLLAVVFHKEGLGIAWGLMFLLLILLSLDSTLQIKNIQKNLLQSNRLVYSAIFLSALILSSNIALILIGLIFIWFFYRSTRIQSFTSLLTGFVAVLLAFLLSAFYIFPAILERDLIHSVSENNELRFLPKTVVEKPQTGPSSPYQILTGDSDIFEFKQGTNWFKFETITNTHTIIRLSQFYFPQWKIFIDGKETQIEYKNNGLGLMTVILGEGKHSVEGKLFDTPIRRISNIVSIISAVAILLLWIVQFKSVRNSLNYYKKRAI